VRCTARRRACWRGTGGGHARCSRGGAAATRPGAWCRRASIRPRPPRSGPRAAAKCCRIGHTKSEEAQIARRPGPPSGGDKPPGGRKPAGSRSRTPAPPRGGGEAERPSRGGPRSAEPARPGRAPRGAAPGGARGRGDAAAPAPRGRSEAAPPKRGRGAPEAPAPKRPARGAAAPATRPGRAPAGKPRSGEAPPKRARSAAEPPATRSRVGAAPTRPRSNDVPAKRARTGDAPAKRARTGDAPAKRPRSTAEAPAKRGRTTATGKPARGKAEAAPKRGRAAAAAKPKPAAKPKTVIRSLARPAAPAPEEPFRPGRAGKPKVGASADGAPRGRKRAPPLAPDRLAQLVEAARQSLEDDKAEEILVLDVTGRADYADRLIIATGQVERQLQAMATHVEEALGKHGMKLKRSDIQASPDWVLIDCGDLVIHLFRPEARVTYGLERMWGPESPAPEGA